jgi:hypothetical protein
MKLHRKMLAVRKIYGRLPTDMDDLGHCVRAVLNAQPASTNMYAKPIKVIGLHWDVEHRALISNTHECPLDGVTNWGGDRPGAPRGYPGWQGRVWVRYADPIDSFGNSPWDATVTHPGTGGWGSYEGVWKNICGKHYQVFGGNRKMATYPQPQCYSWDFKIFDQDWECIPREITWVLLNSVNPVPGSKMTHKFDWDDPHTVKWDKEFMEHYKETWSK